MQLRKRNRPDTRSSPSKKKRDQESDLSSEQSEPESTPKRRRTRNNKVILSDPEDETEEPSPRRSPIAQHAEVNPTVVTPPSRRTAPRHTSDEDTEGLTDTTGSEYLSSSSGVQQAGVNSAGFNSTPPDRNLGRAHASPPELNDSGTSGSRLSSSPGPEDQSNLSDTDSMRNFIDDDDPADAVETENARAELPNEFRTLRQNFEVVVSYLVRLRSDPKFLSTLDDTSKLYYESAIKALNAVGDSLADAISLSDWKAPFRATLDLRPKLREADEEQRDEEEAQNDATESDVQCGGDPSEEVEAETEAEVERESKGKDRADEYESENGEEEGGGDESSEEEAEAQPEEESSEDEYTEGTCDEIGTYDRKTFKDLPEKNIKYGTTTVFEEGSSHAPKRPYAPLKVLVLGRRCYNRALIYPTLHVQYRSQNHR
ncbi:hypothetical protein C8J57DRAFT_1715320 [Mycena rebaudengoi]|nr:hypothetical protein C8J57DRAFT_1715320 [Mycena rebaudengoi]